METETNMSVISKFAVSVSNVPEEKINIKARLFMINTNIIILKKAQRSTFGFEGVKSEIQEKINTLKLEKQTLSQKYAAQQMHQKMVKAGYPNLLDYSPLSWKNKTSGFPAFMVMDLKSNVCTLTVRDISFVWKTPLEYSCKPNLPQALWAEYSKSIDDLGRFVNDHEYSRISISAEFTGVVPEKTRSEIKKAQKSHLFNKIFIIAEAPSWRINQVVRAQGDPLVVGWVNKTKQLYLIDVFYPTPLEDYLRLVHVNSVP